MLNKIPMLFLLWLAFWLLGCPEPYMVRFEHVWNQANSTLYGTPIRFYK